MPTTITITISDKDNNGKQISSEDIKLIAMQMLDHVQTLVILKQEPTKRFICIGKTEKMNDGKEFPSEYGITLVPQIEII